MIAVRVTVSGSVQGVGFRWHTRLRAEEIGVCGWVRNTADGGVQAHLEGDPKAVDQLLDWLAEGPAAARVTDVVQSGAVPTGAAGFQMAHRTTPV